MSRVHDMLVTQTIKISISSQRFNKIRLSTPRIQHHDPSLSWFTNFHWLIMRKTEKGDNSIVDFENITKS